MYNVYALECEHWTNNLFILFFALLSGVLGDSDQSTLRLTCGSSAFAWIVISTNLVLSKWLQSSTLHHGYLLRIIENSQWAIHHSLPLYEQTCGESTNFQNDAFLHRFVPRAQESDGLLIESFRWFVKDNHDGAYLIATKSIIKDKQNK